MQYVEKGLTLFHILRRGVCMTEIDQASKIAEIIEAYPADQRFALAAMQDMQHAFNYIPEEGLVALAKHLGCPQAQLYSMATFYKALSLTPKGQHIIKICNGTACHLRGSMNLATELKRDLNIEPGQTSEDPVLRRARQLPGLMRAGTRHGRRRQLPQQAARRANPRHHRELRCDGGERT